MMPELELPDLVVRRSNFAVTWASMREAIRSTSALPAFLRRVFILIPSRQPTRVRDLFHSGSMSRRGVAASCVFERALKGVQPCRVVYGLTLPGGVFTPGRFPCFESTSFRASTTSACNVVSSSIASILRARRPSGLTLVRMPLQSATGAFRLRREPPTLSTRPAIVLALHRPPCMLRLAGYGTRLPVGNLGYGCSRISGDTVPRIFTVRIG